MLFYIGAKTNGFTACELFDVVINFAQRWQRALSLFCEADTHTAHIDRVGAAGSYFIDEHTWLLIGVPPRFAGDLREQVDNLRHRRLRCRERIRPSGMRRWISQPRRGYGRYVPAVHPGNASVSNVIFDNTRRSRDRMHHWKRLKGLAWPQMGKGQARGF